MNVERLSIFQGYAGWWFIGDDEGTCHGGEFKTEAEAKEALREMEREDYEARQQELGESK